MKIDELDLEKTYPGYKKYGYNFSVVLSQDNKVEFLIKHTSEKILNYIYVIKKNQVMFPYIVKGDSLPPLLDSIFLHYDEIMSIVDFAQRQTFVDDIVENVVADYSKKIFRWAYVKRDYGIPVFLADECFYIKKTEEGYKHFQFENKYVSNKNESNNKTLKGNTKISKRSCEVCGCDISGRPVHHTMCYDCWKNYYRVSMNHDQDKDIDTSNYDVDDFGQSEGYDDEWGFYNIHGEFPDWKK